MELPTEQLARRLGLAESTVARWIRQGRLPATRRDDVCAFDERELEAWARAHKLTLAPTGSPAAAAEDRPVDLLAALHRGGLHDRVGGHDVPSVLAAAVELSPVPAGDRADLLRSLLEREALSSTGIGNRVAVPHPRNPSPDLARHSSVTTCLLEQSVDFNAVDGQPVTAVLLLLSPTVRHHLKLLSRLAFLLRDPTFSAALAESARAARFWAAAEEASDRLEAARRR